MVTRRDVNLTDVRPQWSYSLYEVNFKEEQTGGWSGGNLWYDHLGDFGDAVLPYRLPIGVLDPIDTVTMVTEINRPGSLSIPVAVTPMTMALKDRLVNSGKPPIEIVVSWGTNLMEDTILNVTHDALGNPIPDGQTALEGQAAYNESRKVPSNVSRPVFSGPLVGWQMENKERIQLEFRSDLYYFELMHYPFILDLSTIGNQNKVGLRYRAYTTTGNLRTAVPRLIALLISGAQNPSQLGSRDGSNTTWASASFSSNPFAHGYTNYGIGTPQINGPEIGWDRDPCDVDNVIEVGVDGEPAIDPRDGHTLLDTILTYANRGPDYGFEFEIIRYPAMRQYDAGTRFSDSPNRYYLEYAPVFRMRRKLGEDKSDWLVINDEHLTDDLSVNVSLTSENFASMVYAIGSGSDYPSIGKWSSDRNVYIPAGESGQNWKYVRAADQDLELIGNRLHILGASNTVGASDGENVADAYRPPSLDVAAEEWLQGRTEAFLVPNNMNIIVSNLKWVEQFPLSGGLIAPHYTIEPGDTVGLDFETGFGHGVANSARIKKKTLEIGGIITMSLEFF